MPKFLEVISFLERANTLPIIDVRSPAEYEHAHIPGAFNLPLFENEERVVIGTYYKQRGKIPAVQKGLEFVGPKLKDFTKFAQKLNSKQILIHCWRGGMRSSAMAWLLETIELECYLLKGGYKSYRNYVLETFSLEYKILLLGGPTGAGKTEILQKLREAGEQVIDLEALANHKGSAFGALGQEKQPGSEEFENNLSKELRKLDPEKIIWMEDESRNIGRIPLPQALWEQMRKSPLIMINTSYSARLERLIRDYTNFPTEEIVGSIMKLEKRLGFDNCKFAIEMCNNNDLSGAAKLCLDYYDKAYMYQLHSRFGMNLEGVEVINLDSVIVDDSISSVISASKNIKFKKNE